MNPNSVAWFEIYVQDMNRAKAFYESVFKVSLNPMENPNPDGFNGMEMWGFPSNQETYGAGGALIKMPGFSSGTGGTIVYFASDDCAIEAHRAESLGGKIINPKTSIGDYGFISLIMDTEGNMIGLYSMK